jgi:hypothetical protein
MTLELGEDVSVRNLEVDGVAVFAVRMDVEDDVASVIEARAKLVVNNPARHAGEEILL